MKQFSYSEAIDNLRLRVPKNKSYLGYQAEGIIFALCRKASLIADEMGLGKTVQALGVINNDDSIDSILIVCPASLICNWWNEIDQWIIGKRNIAVTSYEGISKINIATLDLLIVDEAHYTKNQNSIRSKNIKRIAKNAKKIIYLTGTPIENKPVELFPLLQVLDSKTWDPKGKIKGKNVEQGEGAGFWDFAKRYCNAHQERRGNKLYWDFSGNSNLNELGEKLRSSIMIRRMKKDVLKELPSKRHQIVLLPKVDDKLSADLEYYLGYIENSDKYEECINALRNDKIAFEEFSSKRHEQGLSKCEFVIDYVKICLQETNKIIIFAHHRDVIQELESMLDFTEYCLVTSDMSILQRYESVQRFQNDPNCNIILGSIDVMGVGFTLTASSLVLFAEISPVPGKMSQAIDRAHRIGQNESVLAKYLVQDGSIDARMCKILIKKQDVLDKILSTDNNDDNDDNYEDEVMENARLMTLRDPPIDLSGWDEEEIAKELEPWPNKEDAYDYLKCKHLNVKIVNSYYVCLSCNKNVRSS